MLVKKKIHTLILIFVFLTPSYASGDDYELEVETDEFEFELEIKNAYYLDADRDGIQNDVVLEFEWEIKSEEDEIYKLFEREKFFVIEFTLILPSGYSFTYSYSHLFFAELFEKNNYDLDDDELELDIKMYYFDHAIESGDYTIRISLILFDGDKSIYGMTEMIFDPPGSTTGPPLIPQFLFRR